MSRGKESEFALDDNSKESISGRLRKLIGKRSVRAASQAWGLSFSTLNNYLTRGTEPSLNVAIKIAKIENVTVEWLATGVSEQKPSRQEGTENEKTKEFLRTTWMAAFELMGKAEAEALLKIIINGGTRGLIKLAEHESNLEEAFMLLPPELKERAIDLIDAHIESKRGASEGGELASTESPEHESKRAS